MICSDNMFHVYVRLILCIGLVVTLPFVNAATAEQIDQLCIPISGQYSFVGDDLSSGVQRTFFQVLWRSMAPPLRGDPTEIELIHDASLNTLQIKMHGGEDLRLEPRADGLFKLSCVKGVAIYDEGVHEGYADGHHKKWHYLLRFIKNEKGVLTVYGTYLIENETLFFLWEKSKVEEVTRFKPVHEISH